MAGTSEQLRGICPQGAAGCGSTLSALDTGTRHLSLGREDAGALQKAKFLL